MRDYLRSKGIHDFSDQDQGEAHKARIRAYFLTATEAIATTASLYRPITKRGDPRIWFDGLKQFVQGNEALCIVAQDNELFVLKESDVALWASSAVTGSPLHDLIRRSKQVGGAIARELLQLIREKAAAPLKTVVAGDTGVGMTLESAIGLPPNSRRTPDYKGIELKASRKNKKAFTRSTLFAKVPDWEISALKSINEILEAYGYLRNGMMRLNCQMSSNKINSQGLYLWIDARMNFLRERHTDRDDYPDPRMARSFQEVAAWKIAELNAALLEKHRETFWVSATSRGSGAEEVFTYTNILHTKAPFTGAFETLLNVGSVSVDHLIKRPEGYAPKEKGPLFKIHRKDFGLLFPKPDTYKIAL